MSVPRLPRARSVRPLHSPRTPHGEFYQLLVAAGTEDVAPESLVDRADVGVREPPPARSTACSQEAVIRFEVLLVSRDDKRLHEGVGRFGEGGEVVC
jgi:hypothetical protein